MLNHTTIDEILELEKCGDRLMSLIIVYTVASIIFLTMGFSIYKMY